MDVQVAESGPCRRTLTIKIPATQVRQHLKQMYASAATQVNMKGFRPGKIPKAVLEKKYGEQIQAEAKEHLVRQSVADACREHELAMIGRAKLEGIGEEPLTGDADVEFQVHLDVRPEIELGDVTGLEMTRQPTDVTDEDMEQALNDLAGQKRTLETVEDAVEENDFAKVDMTFHAEDGSEVSKREGVQLNPGIPVAGADADAFRASLIGKQAGDAFEVELTYPDTFEVEAVRGKPGKVSIAVHEVLRVQAPPLDDEFAKGYDFETIDALKEELQKRIGEQKVIVEQNRQAEGLLDMIANEHPFDLPETLVDEELEHALAQFKERMKQGGVPEEDLDAKAEEARDEARKDSERRVRMFFLIDSIARKHEIGLSQPEIEAELARVAEHNNVTVDVVREHYEGNQDQANQLRLALVERKVRDFLRDNAKFTDK